jgi:hypothetical protein
MIASIIRRIGQSITFSRLSPLERAFLYRAKSGELKYKLPREAPKFMLLKEKARS